MLTWSLNLKSSDLIGWNYVIQTGEIKSPRFNIRIWSSVARRRSSCSSRRRKKRPVVFLRENASLPTGPLEKGGLIAPQSFTDQLFLFLLENRYFFCSPWILDLPTALIQVLFLTHENLWRHYLFSALINLWRHYLAHWLAVSVTFSQ